MASQGDKKPARISFASITPNNLGTLRKINGVVLPVKYSEKFYQDVLLPELEDFCKLGPSLSSLLTTAAGTITEVDTEEYSLL